MNEMCRWSFLIHSVEHVRGFLPHARLIQTVYLVPQSDS